ncbi:MAG: helix-turn-helix transcriptional regulator [Lentisphaerae bacterium]|nr:helix-turn-helix transcriptional regulator [Lentisphaerota bacterium]
MSTFENIAEELKKLRQQQGWSQEDLARNLGVSFATVNRWENGKTKPSRLAIEKIQFVVKRKNKNVL